MLKLGGFIAFILGEGCRGIAVGGGCPRSQKDDRQVVYLGSQRSGS